MMSAQPANKHVAYIAKPPHQKGFARHANECFGVEPKLLSKVLVQGFKSQSYTFAEISV